MNLRTLLIRDNQRLIEQGITLLEELDEETYASPSAAVASSSIGGHIRHLSDYYVRFLAGRDEGHIDYDQRARDARLERDAAAAIEHLRQIHSRLEELGPESEELSVNLEARKDWPNTGSRSSVQRELQFLLSHTVHHYALIAVILRLGGREPAQEFGVARSTLSYREETRPCAP